MQHEKILLRESGDKIKISVSFWSDFRDHNYNIQSVEIQPKGKRKYAAVHSSDDYTWRSLSMEGRKEYEMKIYLQYVTAEEIQQAKIELWEQIKP